MHIYMYSVRCCCVVNSVATLRQILAIAEDFFAGREKESEREMKFDVANTYFSKPEDGDITNKKINYYVL